jgi:hypothetical protein
VSGSHRANGRIARVAFTLTGASAAQGSFLATASRPSPALDLSWPIWLQLNFFAVIFSLLVLSADLLASDWERGKFNAPAPQSTPRARLAQVKS